MLVTSDIRHSRIFTQVPTLQCIYAVAKQYIYMILVIKLCISIPNYVISFILIHIYVFYEPIASA